MGLCVCLSGVWTGAGVEKVGWECDYVFIWRLDRKLVWRRLGVNMIMCLSGVWTGVGVDMEKVGWGYDYVFIWCLDRSWCGESWEGI